ncbi:MAG: MobA-like NTP transferase domain containing protein [Wenzhouxiangella sp.]|nr:MAG: MobA-like NTP transferase domain containing protein [Wenzhouxiangella sp.]
MSLIDVIVLAGDRGPDDPLARAAGVPGKTLVPVTGQPMLSRSLRGLADWKRLGRVFLVAPALQSYLDAALASGLGRDRLVMVEPEVSPSASVGRALLAAGEARPLLLTTADHVLIKPDWLDQMLADDSGADLLVGVVDFARVMQRFPQGRRTRYRFSDQSVCGTNLFLFRTGKADSVVVRWRQVEQQRKRPWRIISMLGLGNLARYLSGRLSLTAGFSALSEVLGVRIEARMLDDPLAAVDVDSPSDLALVESVLAEETAGC